MIRKELKKNVCEIKNLKENDFRYLTVKTFFFLGAHLHYSKATEKISSFYYNQLKVARFSPTLIMEIGSNIRYARI